MRSAGRSSDQRGVIAPALIALALSLPGGFSFAADVGGANPPTAAKAPAASNKAVHPAPVAPVDINSASRARLRTLPGIGDVEADRIIAGRPYLSKADLATKDTIPTGIYLQIKDRIIAIQKPKVRK